MSKTYYELGQDFSVAWRAFVLAYAHWLRLERLADWLARWLRKLERA